MFVCQQPTNIHASTNGALLYNHPSETHGSSFDLLHRPTIEVASSDELLQDTILAPHDGLYYTPMTDCPVEYLVPPHEIMTIKNAGFAEVKNTDIISCQVI